MSVQRVIAGAMRCRQAPSVAGALASRFASSQTRTSQNNRYVRIENSHIDTTTYGHYPTPGRGHEFRYNIHGLLFTTTDINALQDAIFNTDSFLPTRPAAPLSGCLSDLSDIAQEQAVKLKDGSAGLLASNRLRETVDDRLSKKHFKATMDLLRDFKQQPVGERKTEIGQEISNIAFWSQWLIRGYLFEGKLHWEHFCADMIPAPLSQIAFAVNAALGRHQIEFVYDDYTLKAAVFPKDLDLDAIDYNDPQKILDAIAAIDTLVGFNDVAGGQPEHNFRHNHSLMEHQMKTAFRGLEEVFAGNEAGWDKIVEAAKRANQVFATMLRNTPPATYPAIRLPIKGVRGASGTVYHHHGVFYEGVGEDEYTRADGTKKQGVFVNNEWGQTGANSSMFKWFDQLIGVAQLRHAYDTNPIQMEQMQAVFSGKVDSGELGTNPIDSMQRAFDLFTRPPKHMKMLVDLDLRLKESAIFEDTSPSVLMQRLRLAYWVAEHRVTHGKYVLKSIYQTEPVGNQSRADGTGGSTPPFLKLFLDQTIAPGRSLIIQLLLSRNNLTAEQTAEVAKYTAAFDSFENLMGIIKSKGENLAFEERARH